MISYKKKKPFLIQKAKSSDAVMLDPYVMDPTVLAKTAEYFEQKVATGKTSMVIQELLGNQGGSAVKQAVAEAKKDHEVGVVNIKPNMATVSLSAGMTINLGNYSSAKFEVSLSMPSEVDKVEYTFDFIKTWVNQKMEGLIEEVNEVKGGNDKMEKVKLKKVPESDPAF